MGIPIRLTADLSAVTLQAGREWQNIHTVIKREKMRPRLLYTAKSSFIFNREIKGFSDKQKVRELSNTKTALFTTNAKRTSLDRKHKRKGLQKQT